MISKNSTVRKPGRPVTVWNTQRVRKLRALYPDNDNDKIAEELKVLEGAVRSKAAALGLKKKNVRWSDTDNQWLLDNYLTKPMDQLIKRLAGRTEDAIINQYRQLSGLRVKK